MRYCHTESLCVPTGTHRFHKVGYAGRAFDTRARVDTARYVDTERALRSDCGRDVVGRQAACEHELGLACDAACRGPVARDAGATRDSLEKEPSGQFMVG